jgi:hypothetical protein
MLVTSFAMSDAMTPPAGESSSSKVPGRCWVVPSPAQTSPVMCPTKSSMVKSSDSVLFSSLVSTTADVGLTMTITL